MKTEKPKSLTVKVQTPHHPEQGEIDRGPMSERGNGGYDARRDIATVIAETESEGWDYKGAFAQGSGRFDLIFTWPRPVEIPAA